MPGFNDADNWLDRRDEQNEAARLSRENARLRKALEQISFLGFWTPAISTLKKLADDALVTEPASDKGYD